MLLQSVAVSYFLCGHIIPLCLLTKAQAPLIKLVWLKSFEACDEITYPEVSECLGTLILHFTERRITYPLWY